jgi:hypothetical protein
VNFKLPVITGEDTTFFDTVNSHLKPKGANVCIIVGDAMRFTQIALSMSVVMLYLAACDQSDNQSQTPTGPSPANAQASTQEGPQHIYLPMQPSGDTCYIGNNMTEPGHQTRPCPQ